MRETDDRIDTECWIFQQLEVSGIKRTNRQIKMITRIYLWLGLHEQYDYALGDIRKGVGYVFSSPEVKAGIDVLHILGLLKITRISGRSEMYQLSCWH